MSAWIESDDAGDEILGKVRRDNEREAADEQLWLTFDEAFHAARSATLNELLKLREDLLNHRDSTALGRIDRLIANFETLR